MLKGNLWLLHIMLKNSVFVLFCFVLFCFCPAIKGKEVSFQKRKKQAQHLFTSWVLMLLNSLYSETIHSQPKLWNTEHRDFSYLVLSGEDYMEITYM